MTPSIHSTRDGFRLKERALPFLAILLALLTLPISARAAAVTSSSSPYAAWKHGPPADENFFPIAVWLQDPRNAARYKAAGINLYVGLWRGPTSNQLAQLKQAGVSVICSQRAGLQFKDDPTIVGWMHGDEPDNAQSLGQGKGYGPPILPEKILADYERLRAADPSRPVLLNLGQGVAYDNYIGRGVRRGHLEDYPQYIKGSDIVSFDIYPVVHEKPEISGKLEYVAKGVERLRTWAGPERLAWNCIECTHISNVARKATPDQVRSEVWLALIHGSRGLIYFVHQFKPVFREAALLDDPEMLAGVTAINHRIHELAPVLNSPNISNGATVTSSDAGAPIASMMKRRNGAIYLFTVNTRNRPARGTFAIRELPEKSVVEVLDESRKITADHGAWSDDFSGYAVHLYRIQP